MYTVVKRLVNSRVFKSLDNLRPLSSLTSSTLSNGRSFSTMATNHNALQLVAVAQMTATSDKQQNLQMCSDLVEKATRMGAKVIFFPENCDYIAESQAQLQELAEDLDGNLVTQYKELAKQHNIWISVGGFHRKALSSSKIFNSHLLISSDGEIAGKYDKLHLFDVELPEKQIKHKESDSVERGKKLGPVVKTPVGNVGLGICYDVRFPELSLCLAQRGARILTYPSAFTIATGLAHWESLLRARAIETQCYVVAAAQSGSHNPKRASYGHSMIIDPWGAVIAQCKEGPGLAVAEIDLSYLKKVRKDMPVWNHRRPDIYGQLQWQKPERPPLPEDDEVFQFGKIAIKGSFVFYRGQMSIAFVNKKCVVPGHVLVIPLRGVKRLQDMQPDEIADLFQTVQKVEIGMEKFQKVSSSNVSMQDGPDAGQSVAHVHVHILPRRPGDFQDNDDIYSKLEHHDKGEVQWRTDEEMLAEATALRKFFAEIGL